MATAKHLDNAILSVISERWTKGAMVAALVMREIGDIDDHRIQSRLKALAERGAIEVSGDISTLRACEVRFKGGGDV